MQEKRTEDMKKYAFMLFCEECCYVSTHRFIDFEGVKKYRLKCSHCNHIGYFVHKKEFDEFYEKGTIGLAEITFISIEDTITIDGLIALIEHIEVLLKGDDYPYFESVIFSNLNDINKLNALMKKLQERLKANIPEWAWKEKKL